MSFKIPSFKTDKELFNFIIENEDDIIYSKKQAIKKADAFAYNPLFLKSFAEKQENLLDKDYIDATLIINTTNYLDSHGDVHIKGIWDKSLLENFMIKHIQEHQMSFDKIISDKEDLKAYTKDYSWKELGYNAEGKTQALVFDSRIRKERNVFMFKQYAKGNVDNHSVGMFYVKIVTCINDEDYEEQFKNWQKYSKSVVNKSVLEEKKYFWAVTEAKAIEGSAVPLGSNMVTPTQNIKAPALKNKKELAIKNWLSS